MKKSNIPIIVGVFMLVAGIFFVSELILSGGKIKNTDGFVDISELSDEFMDNYFRGIGEHNSEEEKENMLIVIANKKIQDTYGAKDVIEAPNGQYILQYGSEEEKELALKYLKEDSGIESVEENGVYTIEEGNYNSWGIEKMALDYATTSANINSENMQQVTVAIIDTGCDMALFNKYYGGKINELYNVLEQSTTVMTDEEGHGTHIAGTIAEGTPDNVKILPIKVSRTGSMRYSDIIAAINYIVYNNKAQVINMSFGGYGYNEALDQAIETAKEKNIISVAAAGNDNISIRHYPSSLENTISIASVDSNLNKSKFSNYGAEITFTAPGTDIRSIMGKNAAISRDHGNNDDDDHEIISGTSMATPHAVAAVVMLKGYNKNLTFENVVDILKDNAIDLGEKGWDQYYGNGLISFKDVEFCDGTYCDELGIYKDLNKSIASIDATNLSLTQYNYYSITNLMGSKVNVIYADNASEEMTIGELPNVEVLNYNPTATGSQTVTIKMGSLTTTIQVTNPNNYESGWEYNTLPNGKIEITGYKNHNLEIEKLYVPETIDSKQVVSFADNFKLSESGNDIESYTYLYLPSTFTRIGDYTLSETNIKYIYGEDNKVEVGAHAFENSKIVSIDIPITKIEDYAFKDCFELVSIKVWEEQYAWNNGRGLVIGNYAFYNCKKLATIEMTNEQGYNTIGDIGNYAFYNCVSLSYFDLEPGSDIGEYAFYGTYLLTDVDLYQSESIGRYAFFGGGISEVDFSISLEVVNESSFENCRNLKEVSFTGGRIESRAFWNSGVERISIWDYVEYIAEDAFAYTPMKSSIGVHEGTGNYKSVSDLGIIESSTNKLLIGFTDHIGASNTNIPDYVTEIGNYAFTGNNNLKKITIPANVTKIGAHAFEDCYQLSDVYMLGSTIDFGNDSFKRTYEGEINGADLKIYVYKDSAIKQFVKNKNLSYRHIEPDEVIVTNYEDTYKAKSQVNLQTLEVKLIYHEEEDREEILGALNPTIVAPISNGVGFNVRHQTENAYNFEYGDTYFIVEAKNAIGYLSTQNVDVTVEKATPTYTVPTGLTANFGQQLSEVTLPEHFEWMDESQIIASSGEAIYKAKYIPTDTKNYEIVENIDIVIMVSNGKTIIEPEITIENKVYDGTTDIPVASIAVSNLESSEYSVVSATASSADAGERSATIVLRLSDKKFENYAFDNGQQEKGFTIEFTIEKANLPVNDSSSDKAVMFDGASHTIDISLEYPSSAHIKYRNADGEYSLDQIPEYIEAGEYVIGYKLYIDENYTEYVSERTLTILSDFIVNFDEGLDIQNGNIVVNPGDTFSSITDKIHTIPDNNSIEHRDKDNNVVSSEITKTGDKIKITVNGHEQEYDVVVIGDIDGDGEIGSADYLKIKEDIMDIEKLTSVYKKAADMNNNNEVDIIDYIRVKKIVKGGNL